MSVSACIEGRMAVVPISKFVATAWCQRWHYTGTLGNAGVGCFGYRQNGRLDAVVVIGPGGNRFGVASKFGLEAWRGNVEVTRVVVNPLAVRNTASKAIAAVSHRLAAAGYDWVFSYADTEQGHHGGIYQAVNAVYVGTTARQWVNFALDGQPIAKRAVGGRFGTTRWPDVREIAAAQGHDLIKVPWYPKLTYILVVASKRRTRRHIRAALEGYRLPYPKRDEHLQTLVTPHRNARPPVVVEADPQLELEDAA